MTGPRIVWRPDVRRYLAEDTYAESVDAFVKRFLPGVAPVNAYVVEAADGDRGLFGPSFVDKHGDLYTDERGYPGVQQTRGVPLPESEPLP